MDIESLATFIDSTPIGNGIDTDEAVEDALYEALNLNWSEINTRSIVLFGDARAHEPNECDKGHDYFELTKKLYNQQTIINTVFVDIVEIIGKFHLFMKLKLVVSVKGYQD